MEFLAGWLFPSVRYMLWKDRMDSCGHLVVSATNMVSFWVSPILLILSLNFHEHGVNKVMLDPQVRSDPQENRHQIY